MIPIVNVQVMRLHLNTNPLVSFSSLEEDLVNRSLSLPAVYDPVLEQRRPYLEFKPALLFEKNKKRSNITECPIA